MPRLPTRSIVALALSLAAGSAFGERPSSLDMTCGEALDLVRSSGAVVLGTGGQTYERFVAHPGYCVQGEGAHGAWARTSDESRCPIGFVCKPGRRSSADD